MSTTIDYGIDLGTTNSAIARYVKGEVIVFKNPISLKETLPSVVAFKNERTIVGDKAREMLKKSSNNVFGLFKRKMGTSDSYMVGDTGNMLSPIQLSSIILKELKNFIHSEGSTESVVITIPSAFDTVQSNATKKAGYEAGFKEVVLLQEPIAASLAYANKSNLNITDGKWLVYDLGGGTFDVALTAIDDGELKILDHEGDNYLGGTDFDKAIIEQFIIPKLKEKGTFANLETELKTASGKYNRLFYKLMFLAEEAKKELTNSPIAEIEFEVTDDKGDDLDIYLELSKEVFESLIQASIDKTIQLIDAIIERNQISNEDLKCILLIGGSTYIPLVRSRLHEKYGIEINTSLDPTTAVVIGAAYYAGIKPKAKKTATSSATTSLKKGNFKFAYERVVREASTMLLVMAQEETEGLQYRITRSDGGFDSGLLPMSKQITADLPLIPNAHNAFQFNILDSVANRVFVEEIGITQGKFSIDGQPLPNNICLEVDSIESETTFLEPVFKKNDILPLRKVITKQVSKTIYKDSNEEIVIKVFEGDIDSIPAANKLIGMISVSGSSLDRDLIKGSDIELTLEITESRDLKVGAYFTLTDQEFENTFSSSESSITKSVLQTELNSFQTNLGVKLQQLEKDAKYEEAARVVAIDKEINELKSELEGIADDQISDDFYVLDVRKRELGKKMQAVFNTSFLTKTIEDYYEWKETTEFRLIDKEATEQDNAEFKKVVEDEVKFLQEGNITTIKMKINHLLSICRRIAQRTPMTSEDVMMHYLYLKGQKYMARSKANDLIAKGDHALENKNYIELVSVIKELSILKDKEGNSDLFKNKGTGLK